MMASPDTNTTDRHEGSDGSQRGSGVVSRVRESTSAQLSTQKNKATEGLGSVAQAVRQSTQQLREQQHETIAGYIESAADQIERFSQRLREKEVAELLEDAQRLARRQPAVFIGSAFALGLLGVRFFKSSARRDREYTRYGSVPSPGRDEYRNTTAAPYTSQAHDRSTTVGGGASIDTTMDREGYTAGAAGAFADDTASTSTAASSGRTGGTSAGSARKRRGSTESERS